MKTIIILLLTLTFPLKSQDLSDMVLPFTDHDIQFLRYINIVNKFDTAFVDYTAGEFTVLSGKNKNRIPFLASFDEYSWIGGDSLRQGEDTNLTNHTKTINFMIPQNSTISFFRKMYALITCGKYDGIPEDPDGGGTGDWRDMLWHCGKNRILDKSEFVIQLVNSSNDQVVFNIDSVGVDPNPNSNIAQRYGLNNTVMNHSVAIPSNLWGTNCYIRISPRRWGTTPNGMELQIFRTSWSMSTFYEFNPTYRFFRYHDSIVKPIYDSIVAARLLPYLDSVKKNTGFLPDYSNFQISDSLLNEIYQKFGGIIMDIGFSPVAKDVLRMEYNIQEEIPFAIIGLYSIDGRKITDLWKGGFSKGQGELILQTDYFAAGTYLIIITDSEGKRLDLAKIIIE